MTEHDSTDALDDLDPVLSDLANATRSRDAEDPAFGEDAGRRALGEVHRVIRGVPAGAAGAIAPKPRRLRAAAVLASACVLVAFAGSRLVRSENEPSSAIATPGASSTPLTATPPEPVKTADTIPTMHIDDLPTSATAPRPPAPTQPRATSSATPAATAPAGTDLAEEYRLIEGGRTGLAAGDHARALESLREHERRFPKGQLNQERESLQIEVLVAAGRLAEARERARSFQAHFPNGLLMPSVTRALAGPSADASVP